MCHKKHTRSQPFCSAFAHKRQHPSNQNIHIEIRYIRNESVVQTLEQKPPLPLHNSAGKMRERLELGVFSLGGAPDPELAPGPSPDQIQIQIHVCGMRGTGIIIGAGPATRSCKFTFDFLPSDFGACHYLFKLFSLALDSFSQAPFSISLAWQSEFLVHKLNIS